MVNPEEVERLAVDGKDAAGRPVRLLEEKTAARTAQDLGLDLRGVYLAAMQAGIYPKRYLRNRDCISLAEQIRLAQSTVAIVGAGGLGGHVILQLARLGIGGLRIIDFDVFDETNLNRQMLADENSLGKSKAETAARTVSLVNPAVQVAAVQAKIQAENAAELLQATHVVVDALDNIPGRFVLADAARTLNLPLVHGAIAGFEGRIMTFFPEDQGLQRLYGERSPAGEARPTPPEAILGNPAVTPAVTAAFQVMEVLKILLKRGHVFRDEMAYIQLESGQVNLFSF